MGRRSFKLTHYPNLYLSFYLSSIWHMVLKSRKKVRRWLKKNKKRKTVFKTPSSTSCLLVWPHLVIWSWGFSSSFPSFAHHLLICFPKQVIVKLLSAMPGVWERMRHLEFNFVWWEPSHVLSLIKTCFAAVTPGHWDQARACPCGRGGRGGDKNAGEAQRGKEAGHCPLEAQHVGNSWVH